MIRFFSLSLTLVPLFFLTSCFSMHSDVVIGLDGKISIASTIDMSKMAALVANLSSWSVSTGSINVNLCDDKNFSSWLNEWKKDNEIVKCTNTGDYRAKVETESSIWDNLAILVMSGIMVIDAMNIDSNSESAKSEVSEDQESAISPEDMWFSVSESITFPWNVVYKDAGKLSSANTLTLNLLDPKISKKKELFIIATQDGKKLKPKEIARYKQLLRKQIRLSKKK